MKRLEQIKNSPITESPLVPYLTCEDFMVSRAKFTIQHDLEADFLITTPRPFSEDLMSYYESQNYISHTDKSTTLFERTYQTVRTIAIKSKINKIVKSKSDIKNILDVGCGTGDFLLGCTNKKWQVFGVEPNDKARQIASGKLNSNTIFETLETLKSQTNSPKFDVITLWHVLEHVPNLQEYILSLKSLLKTDGILVIAVPNFKSFDAQHYKNFWAAYDVPRHLWHFSPKSIAMLFGKFEMTVFKFAPMIFDAFYVSALSESYKNKKNNFIKAFCIGLFSNFKALFSGQYSSLTYFIQNKAI